MWSKSKLKRYLKDQKAFISFYSPDGSCNIARTLIERLGKTGKWNDFLDIEGWVTVGAVKVFPIIRRNMMLNGWDFGSQEMLYPQLGLNIFYTYLDGKMYATDVDHVS